MPPVAIVGGYAFLQPLFAILSRTDRVKPLPFDSIFNASGMLLQTLYVLLCKDSLGYLMAQTHAAGPDTLALYPDVLMWGEKHMSMLWLGLLAIGLYIIGMYSVLVYAVYEAPSKWADMGFPS